jgi:ribosomal protein L11
MSDTHKTHGNNDTQTLQVPADHVKMDSQGHLIISDPKVAHLLQQKAGIDKGNALSSHAKSDKVEVSVSVTVKF